MPAIQALEVIALSAAINFRAQVHLDAIYVAGEVDPEVSGFIMAIANHRDPGAMARESLKQFWSEHALG